MPRETTERKVDKSVENTFPASDPPALHSSAEAPPPTKGVPKRTDNHAEQAPAPAQSEKVAGKDPPRTR